ncbi:hypothetical protein MHU86_21017 [Fragilaria crotonensis]|nr:hypothetical protein MHU86_21017 [Fragilaria crotonensis]
MIRQHGLLRREDNTAYHQLSHTPWVLRYSEDASQSPNQPYPSFSYLDLRRQQGDSWAASNLAEGIALAKAGKSKEAEACYQQSLDLVANHAPTLVAYGALCANLGRTDEGIARLKEALAVDSSVENGKKYLDAIEQQQLVKQQREIRSRENANTLTLRADNALQSAIAESAISFSDGQQHDLADAKYPLLPENYTSSSEDDNRRRKRKKKKKKRKRKRHDSDDSSEEGSRRRRKMRKKHRRRSRDSSSP